MYEQLCNLLKAHTNPPFLFLGSGFSRRYLGLEDWEGLLERFCKDISPFNYYKSMSDGNLSICASKIADDYATWWWKSEKNAERSKLLGHLVTTKSMPLKMDISDHIRSTVANGVIQELRGELNAFDQMNVQGIITTNWDNLLETLLPDYRVFVGQKQILTGTPQNVGEIYKIHGCITEPTSMILTMEDYDNFSSKMAYLASKLLTIFVENPVVFIGYSISDKNIIDILRSVINGLGSSEIERLQQNLIFIQRTKEERPPGIQNHILVVDGQQIPITQVIISDFGQVYKAIGEQKLRLPVKVLRFLKEQLYEIVKQGEPSEKMALVNIEDIENRSDVEFVVGLGVAHDAVADIGYAGISSRELFLALFDKTQLDADKILDAAIPNLLTKNSLIPVHRFIQEAGRKINQCNKHVQELCERSTREIKGYSAYRKAYDLHWATSSTEEIISGNNNTEERAALLICFQPEDNVNLAVVEKFLKDNIEEFLLSKYSSFYKRLACRYDYLRYKQNN